jgi:hypothetical protein
VVKGNQDVSKNQTETPTTKRIIPLVNAETPVQNTDVFIPEVPQTDTNEHVKETSAQSADDINREVPQTDTNEHVKETSAQSADDIIPEVPHTDTNEHVKETSAQNVDDIIPEVPQINTNENVNAASAQIADAIIEEKFQIEAPVADIPLVLGNIDSNRSRDRNTHTPSKKNDMNKSSSKWSISNLAEYLIFENCITNIKMPTRFSPYSDDIYEMVQKDILRRLQIVKSIDLKEEKCDSYSKFLRQLMSIINIETGSRLVLDALLVPLCSALGLQLELEKTINCNDLPNCRFDYCIRKREHIIGCVEAKSVKSLSDSSIAQAILQLMVLQKTLLRTEAPKVDISKFPVFAIVTDGHRFIYIQLKGSSLGFEHDGGKLRIREVKEKDDFKDILHHIRFLVEGDKKQG